MGGLGNKEIMSKNIQRYMNMNNISRRELSKRLNVGYSTVTDWINAVNYPRIDKIEMMANMWGIDKSDLVEEFRPDDITVAAHMLEDLTPEQLADVKKYIDFIKSQDEG